MKRFDLGGFLLLESSPGSYHVVFDRSVDWSENMRIVAWVALLSKKEKLRRWFLMQCIKQKPTLRISEKYELYFVSNPSHGINSEIRSKIMRH